MASQVFSLLLSFVLLLPGRDKVWTPTFKGTQAQRFEQALRHYHSKMRLTDDLVFDLAATRGKGLRGTCANVQRSTIYADGFQPQDVVLVRWFSGDQVCADRRPEHWALHEACHLRMMHHLGAPAGRERGKAARASEDIHRTREREVRQCMVWYSAKERR